MTEKNKYTRAEFLIYKYVQGWAIQVRLLVDLNIDEALNMPPHNLEKKELITLLFKMFEDRLLVLLQDKRGYFSPNLTELELAPEEPPICDLRFEPNNQTYYCFTSVATKRFRELSEIYEDNLLDTNSI
ncbi:MAG: hypothetical protein V3U87_17095 [Methylococcaceae bacterium]